MLNLSKWRAALGRSRRDLEAEDDSRAVEGISGIVRLADIELRKRVIAAGVIVEKTFPGSQDTSMSVRISDGTGMLQIVFLGQADVPGVVVGSRLVVEGLVMNLDGIPTIQNPAYRLMGMAI